MPAFSIEQPTGVPLESGMGTVVAWGANDWGQCNVPKGLKGVRAIAAGWGHSVALKNDGTVVAWGINDFAKQSTVPRKLAHATAIVAGGDSTAALYTDDGGSNSIHRVSVWGYQAYGLTNVPADLPEVTGLAAGYNHIVALLSDGHVRSWGDNTFGQTKVPSIVADVAAVAAGGDHTLALTHGGKVFAWGYNRYGECTVPANLGTVTAVAAGRYHSLALRSDGTVAAWGSNSSGQKNVPKGLANAVAIAAGNEHSIALHPDGSATAWGRLSDGHDIRLGGALQSIAAGSFHNLGLRTAVGFYTESQFEATYRIFAFKNSGRAPLNIKSVVLSGDDAADFRFHFTPPKTLAAPVAPATSTSTYFQIDYNFAMGGHKTATLTVTTDDPDPARQVFVIPLTAYTPPIKAVRAGPNSNAILTFTPLVLDRTTGLLVQTVAFTGGSLANGLSLEVSGLPAGVTLYSSSASAPGAVEVLYPQPIGQDETAQLTLVYSDPRRRTNWQPQITAVKLAEPIPQPGETEGTLTRVYSVRPSARGPLLDFATAPGGLYVVEYSDDDQTTWHAAVHRLKASGTRLAWMDRGQPETQTKPVDAPQTANGRFYRVKRVAVR